MKVKRLLALFLAVLMLAGCSGAGAENTTQGTKENKMLPKDKEYNILFIGNSYTFYNDMPTACFQAMATTCGYNVKVATVTKGAYTLEKFADPTDPYGQLVANALKQEGVYDYVIIQEQSVRPAKDPAAFYAGAAAVAEKIRKTGAQPVFYATWGRQEGSDKLAELNMTSEQMYWTLAAAYATAGEALQIPVCNAGLAFLEVNTTTQVDLYNADKSHPSAVGSYLAAMTLLAGIFGIDPVSAPFSGPLSGEEDMALRTAAYKAVFEPPTIPEEYMTKVAVQTP